MLLRNIRDTLSFFFIAFYYSSDVFMAANFLEIALEGLYLLDAELHAILLAYIQHHVAKYVAQTYRGVWG
jgi:uncharacterized PurR-regulated membrane protein YhhQ (DUF165 family)